MTRLISQCEHYNDCGLDNVCLMYLQHGIPSPSNKDSALVSVGPLPLHGQEAQAAHAAEVLLKSCTEPRDRRARGREERERERGEEQVREEGWKREKTYRDGGRNDERGKRCMF